MEIVINLILQREPIRMADTFSKPKRSKIMAAISSKHTKPEVRVRKALLVKGYHYKLHYGKEKIDIAFPRAKVAVFVDGCFWHKCPFHSHLPKSNKSYWLPKLRKNVKRAKEKDVRLKRNGWRIIHIWEHDVHKMARITKRIKHALGDNVNIFAETSDSNQ